ncbi:hypothetical protein TNCV_4459371 [Trichonephila clavipes]|nr:hypothetical protein TNCV_4459371 [Trichonephila clavipes]
MPVRKLKETPEQCAFVFSQICNNSASEKIELTMCAHTDSRHKRPTDKRTKRRRTTQNENEVCENPWPLPQISIAETVSSDDEGDLEPLRKRCKPLSDSDND